MPIKGTIATDHFPRNNYRLEVPGLGTDLTVISTSDFEEELETATLADRRMVSGGNTQAFEIDVVMPSHHRTEQAAMEKWYNDSKQPVAIDYKKPATLNLISNSGTVVESWSLSGTFPKKRMLTGADMENEGESMRTTWTLCVDEMVRL